MIIKLPAVVGAYIAGTPQDFAEVLYGPAGRTAYDSLSYNEKYVCIHAANFAKSQVEAALAAELSTPAFQPVYASEEPGSV
jgi:hypothetical protein